MSYSEALFLIIFISFVPIGVIGLIKFEKIAEMQEKIIRKSISHSIFGLPVSPEKWNRFWLRVILITLVLMGVFTTFALIFLEPYKR